MKIELKHLTSYLPYNLKITKEDWGKIGELVPFIKKDLKGLQIEIDYALTTKSKPILRPMNEVEDYFLELYGKLQHQDITDYLDEDFLSSMDNLDISEIGDKKIEYLPYGTIQVLLKHHFDIFDLIAKGLALNINDFSLAE